MGMESITGAIDDNPEHQQRPHLTSYGATMTIIKCAIGAGSFSLPRAFMDGGVYLSFFFTLFLGLLSAYTVEVLMDASEGAATLKRQQAKRAVAATDSCDGDRNPGAKFTYTAIIENTSGPSSATEIRDTPIKVETHLTYPEVGAVAFPELQISILGTKCNVAYLVISLGIMLTSLGVSAAYVDFISDTLPDVLRNCTDCKLTFLTRSRTPWFIMPIILGLSFLRTFKVLTYTSVIGNVAVFSGCIGVIIYGYLFYRNDVTLDHNFVEWKTLPRYVGGNTFLFAIHVVILPIMQQIDGSDGNGMKKHVIGNSFFFITLFNAIFGVTGFLLFASSECKNVHNAYLGPCDNILSNMSGGYALDVIRILVCIDLLFTVPLILAASRVLIEKLILDSETTRGLHRQWSQYSNRRGTQLSKSTFYPQLDASEADSAGLIRVQNPLNLDKPTSQNGTFRGGYTNLSNGSESKENPYADNVELVGRRTSESSPLESDVNSTQQADSLKLPNNTFFVSFIEYTVRTILVITVILMSVSLPQFGDMVDLVGGLVMPLTCFLLPSAMQIRLSHHSDQLLRPADGDDLGSQRIRDNMAASRTNQKRSMPPVVYFGHVLIMAFGFLTMIATTALTLMSD